MSEALNLTGLRRVFAGDAEAVADVEKSVELARAGNAAGTLARALNNLAVAHQFLGNLETSYAVRLEAREISERTGSESLLRWFDAVLVDHLYRRGEWDEALRTADAFLATVEAGAPNIVSWQAYAVRSEMRLARGDRAGAIADAEAALAAGTAVDEVQALIFPQAIAAHVFSTASENERARAVALELLEWLRNGNDMQFSVINLPPFAVAASRLGLMDELVQALEHHPESPWLDVVRAYAAQDFVAAADILRRIGSKPAEAEARWQAAEDLGAEDQRRLALEFYRSVGAGPPG
jgi:hypothetical protein